MNYRSTLLFRWSTRDILAILALAVIVAFLTGSVLFYTPAKDKPTKIAQEFQPTGQVTEYASVQQARQSADKTDIVLRFIEREQSNRLLVGVDQSDRRQAKQFGLDLPQPPATGVGTFAREKPQTITVQSKDSTATVQVTPLQRSSPFPERWYISRPTVIDRIGATGAFVISPSGSGSISNGKSAQSQTVIRSTLLFFERGTRQVLNGFVFLVVVAGILGAVTIASVVQMTVRDRIETIQVIRATGATPASLLGLFGLRGVLLTGTAIALGYAIGVILSSVVTSIAVFAGLPTTLSPRVTADAARLLVFAYAPILLVGFSAAVLATIPVVRRPPGRLTEPRGNTDAERSKFWRFRASLPGISGLQTQILDWRAVYPTIATVAVFSSIVLLVVAGGVVAEPFSTNSTATVMEPDAAHPVVSKVPASYASAFTSRNLSASPEILVFGLVNREPAIIRGGNYDSFAAVSDAELVRGKPPTKTSEAVVGVDFARTHDVAVGETVVIGGGTERTVTRVQVVGAYQAPGAYDDQILVSLTSARHLSSVRPGNVNFVRLSEAIQRRELDPSIRVVSVAIRGTPTTNGASVTLSLVNVAETNQSRRLAVKLGEQQITRRVMVSPGEKRKLTVQFRPDEPRNYSLSAGALSTHIEVRDPHALTIEGLPDQVPPSSSPLIRVTTIAGSPADNTTVTVGNRTYHTDAHGYVRPLFSTTGTQTVRASNGEYVANETIAVTNSAKKIVQASITVNPANVSEFGQPTARLRLYNPWNASTKGTVQVEGAEKTFREQFQIKSGEQTKRDFTLARLPAGRYSVTASINGSVVAEKAYQVSGNDRLSTVVLRNTEAASGGGLGATISIVFGNLTVVIGGLVALAAVMVSGALVASFSRAIHARRRTLGIYRATGAPPLKIITMILRDTLLIGSVSVTVGLVLGIVLIRGLATLDLLVFYGIRIVPSFSVGTLVTVGGAALGLVLVGALIPTITVLRKAPAASFSTVNRPTREGSHD